LAIGIFYQDWTLVEEGLIQEGLARMRQGVVAYQAHGMKAFVSFYLAILIGAYGKADRTEEGLGYLTEALTIVKETGECFHEAELYRLKGELLLKQAAAPGEVEQHFNRAIGIAREQQAKSLELRAVMSLARLWQQQGKGEKARRMLADIYNWFTEGFDTADLKEAKALLEELA
jgi:predicted ATPase